MSGWIFHGGDIRTMAPGGPEVGSLAVRGGRIVDVRPPGAPPPPAAPGERVIDLAGCTLLPGFVDAHTHLIHWGFRFIRPELSGAANRADLLERVRAAHERLAPGRPLIGEGWDESNWPDRGFPTRDALDGIDAARPIMIRRICGHLAVANRAALEQFPDSPEVDRESGLVLEESAMGIARFFPPSVTELDEALAAAQRSYLGLGVTQVHDMSLPDHLRAMDRAAAAGGFRLAVASILTRPHLDVLVDSGLGAGWRRGGVRIRGVKFFSDGSLGARTAALRAPYADRAEALGALLLDPAALARDVARAESAGVPLAIHAIGDRATAMVLAAFESGLGGRPSTLEQRGAPCHRIEHLEMVDEGGLDTMARLRIEASMQPNFVGNWGRAGGLYAQRLGPERTAAMNPMATVLSVGVGLVLGSDGMPAGVLSGLADAVDAPHAPQCLTVDQALAAATRDAARSGGFTDRGTLDAGAVADLVVLSDCPPGGESGAAAAGRLRAARVQLVLTGGEAAFESLVPNPATASGGKG